MTKECINNFQIGYIQLKTRFFAFFFFFPKLVCPGMSFYPSRQLRQWSLEAVLSVVGEWTGAGCSSSTWSSAQPPPQEPPSATVGIRGWDVHSHRPKSWFWSCYPAVLGKLGRFATCPQFLFHKEHAPHITSLGNAALNRVPAYFQSCNLSALSYRFILLPKFKKLLKLKYLYCAIKEGCKSWLEIL